MVQKIGSMAPNSLPKVAVVILAGGQSSRMGKNKALLPSVSCPEDTLLDRACGLGSRLLMEIGQDPTSVFVSGLYPHHKSISDLVPGVGPLGGIQAALNFFLVPRSDLAGFDHALFLPVDMPALKSLALVDLIQSTCGSRAGHFAGFELPALIRIEHHTEGLLLRKLRSPAGRSTELSVKALLQDLSAETIEPKPEYEIQFLNVNTPGDYAQWSTEGRDES